MNHYPPHKFPPSHLCSTSVLTPRFVFSCMCTPATCLHARTCFLSTMTVDPVYPLPPLSAVFLRTFYLMLPPPGIRCTMHWVSYFFYTHRARSDFFPPFHSSRFFSLALFGHVSVFRVRHLWTIIGQVYCFCPSDCKAVDASIPIFEFAWAQYVAVFTISHFTVSLFDLFRALFAPCTRTFFPPCHTSRFPTQPSPHSSDLD